MKRKPAYYSGTSGLVLPVPKYRFPEPYREASRLSYYATFFNSLEVNSIFYKLPLAKTLARWAEEVPAHFRFTFKLWQEVSHVAALRFKEENVQQFFRVIAGADSRKGCVLIQLPPSTGVSCLAKLEALLDAAADQGGGWPLAVEFRNKSWYREEVYELLKHHQAAMVVHDMPQSASPLISTAPFVYVRFHGPEGKYRGSYAEHQLSEYAGYIREWLEEGKAVYSYFNNTIGDAFRNQLDLDRMVLG